MTTEPRTTDTAAALVALDWLHERVWGGSDELVRERDRRFATIREALAAPDARVAELERVVRLPEFWGMRFWTQYGINCEISWIGEPAETWHRRYTFGFGETVVDAIATAIENAKTGRSVYPDIVAALAPGEPKEGE